jgi:F0F1-type ATP synthase assembly protein I
MVVHVLSVVPPVLGGVAGGYIGNRRIQGRMQERERSAWRSAPLRERARVRRQLRRGRAVDNPQLASVAAELAASLQKESLRLSAGLISLAAAVGAAAAIVGLSAGNAPLGAFAIALAGVCAAALALMPRRHRLAEAEQANRRLAAASTPAGGD